MNKTKQVKVLKSVKSFIEKYFDKEMTCDMQFLTGEEGMTYSEYASEGSPYISFDGGIYEYMNYGIDGWKFTEKFTEFLEKKGLYYEMGHAWNLSICED